MGFGGLGPLTWKLPGLSPWFWLSSRQCSSSGACRTFLRKVLLRPQEAAEAESGQHRAAEGQLGLHKTLLPDPSSLHDWPNGQRGSWRRYVAYAMLIASSEDTLSHSGAAR